MYVDRFLIYTFKKLFSKWRTIPFKYSRLLNQSWMTRQDLCEFNITIFSKCNWILTFYYVSVTKLKRVFRKTELKQFRFWENRVTAKIPLGKISTASAFSRGSEFFDLRSMVFEAFHGGVSRVKKCRSAAFHHHGDERRRYRVRRSFVCHFLAATRGNKGRGTKHETKSNPTATGEQARKASRGWHGW